MSFGVADSNKIYDTHNLILLHGDAITALNVVASGVNQEIDKLQNAIDLIRMQKTPLFQEQVTACQELAWRIDALRNQSLALAKMAQKVGELSRDLTRPYMVGSSCLGLEDETVA